MPCPMPHHSPCRNYADGTKQRVCVGWGADVDALSNACEARVLRAPCAIKCGPIGVPQCKLSITKCRVGQSPAETKPPVHPRPLRPRRHRAGPHPRPAPRNKTGSAGQLRETCKYPHKRDMAGVSNTNFLPAGDLQFVHHPQPPEHSLREPRGFMQIRQTPQLLQNGAIMHLQAVIKLDTVNGGSSSGSTSLPASPNEASARTSCVGGRE